MAPHILVIDDRINLPRFIAIELEAVGYQVSIQSDSITELSMMRQFNPDLIILNWELRSASGPEICRQLGIYEVPIIAVTAKDESSCEAACRIGARACLTKPFSISDLLDTIEHHLEKSRAKCSCS